MTYDVYQLDHIHM